MVVRRKRAAGFSVAVTRFASGAPDTRLRTCVRLRGESRRRSKSDEGQSR
jgi:hypothetical protein